MAKLRLLNCMRDAHMYNKNKQHYTNSSFMCVNTGSSLLELTIYLGIFLCVFSLCYGWVVRVYTPLMRQSNSITTVTPLLSGITKLCCDLYAAPSAISGWKKITDHELIWHIESDFKHGDKRNRGRDASGDGSGYDVGWIFEKQTLKRTEGMYDAAAGRWRTSTAGLVAAGIESIVFIINQKNGIIRGNEIINGAEIACMVSKSGCPVDNQKIQKFYVALRNKN